MRERMNTHMTSIKTLVRRKTKFAIVATVLVAWILLLVFIGPSGIANALGATGYLFAFLVASFGGVSSFTAASYFATIATLAAAGLNPFLLGIVGGAGVTIGDSLFFFFGTNGRVVLPDKIETTLNRARRLLDRFPYSTPLFVFLYAGFTPFPNEFMTISVGLTGTRYREIVLPLLIGNIVATTMLAWVVQYVVAL